MEYVKIKYRGECSIMFCGNCGKKIDENAKFCPYCGVSVNKKLLKDEKTFPDSILAQKKHKRIRTIVIGTVIIAAVGIGAVAVRQKKLDDEYNTYLNEAQQYLSDFNYEKAEVVLRQALDGRPEKKEAYIILAEVYQKEEKDNDATEILEKALEQVKLKKSEQAEIHQYVANIQDGREMKTGELSSNDKETLENSEAIQTESEQENPKKQNKWQEAYIDYLNEKVDDKDEMVKCFLIYIDKDDIPELLIDYGVTAFGKDVCAYDGQGLQTINVLGGGFGYQKKGGLFQAGGGNNAHFYEKIYSLEDGKFKLLAEGNYSAEDDTHIEFDENGDMICRYYWDNQDVTKEEYQEKKEQCYNSEKDTSVIAGYTDDIAYGKQEIIDYLRNMISSNLKETEETAGNSDNADQISQECYEPSINGPIEYQILVKNIESGLNVRKEANYNSELVTTITDDTNMIYEGEWKIGPGSDGKNHIWVKVSNGFKGWVRSDLVLAEGRYYQKIGDSVNLRSDPTHDSQLVATIEDSSPLFFYGETEQGYGSDGKRHEWYKVYLGDGISGWVRSDLVKAGEQYG